MSGAMLLGPTGAGAAPTGVAPGWFTSVGIQPIRAAGSETSFYVMAHIGDLFMQTSIFGCTLSSTDNRTCVTTADGAATDVQDNYSRNEFNNGAGIGSGGGLAQLCNLGAAGALGGAPLPDFARTSRAAKSTENGGLCPSPTAGFVNNGNTYNGPVDLLYADDSVAGLDFPVNNSTTVACTATCTATQIGPVAGGWVPGNPLAGPYSNKAVTDLDNLPTETGGGIASSIIQRLQCGLTTPTDPHLQKISDWGQLTDPTPSGDSFTFVDKNGNTQNYSPTKGQEGIGAPIGVPIYLPQVNTKSGTESTWQTFSGCTNVDANSDITTGSRPGNVTQENDAPQLFDIGNLGGAGTAAYLASQVSGDTSALQTLEGTFFPAAAPAGDNIYASNLVAASIYYISFGVSIWEPHTTTSAGGVGHRTSINFIATSQTNEKLSTCTLLNSCNLIATARQLHNYVNPKALRASTLGFMNWICNSDPSGTAHGTDLTTGKNYSTELSSTLNVVYFFPREDCSGASGALVPTDLNS